VPFSVTAACGACVLCACQLRPTGMGWPKAGGLGWELGQGREATVALGRMEGRVNSRFCLFLLYLFQIKFKSVLNLVQTQ
jgi:hypothetical protein